MKTNRKRFLCLLTCLVFCFSKVQAKTFIIGVEDVSYYPIYDFSSVTGHHPSFTKDLLSAFFEKHQYSYRFVALPIKRFNQWYIERGIDFKFPDNQRWREGTNPPFKVTYSEPVLQLMAGSYMLKSRLPMARHEVKSMGTILGFHPSLWLDRVKSKELILQEESSPLSIVKHLLHGNIDVTNIDINVIRYNLKKLKRSGAVVLNKAIPHEEIIFHLSSVKYPEVISEFNLFLKNNAQLVKALKKKYQITEAIQYPQE